MELNLTLILAIFSFVILIIWTVDSVIPTIFAFCDEIDRKKTEKLKKEAEERSWAYKAKNKEKLKDLVNAYYIG